MATKAQEYSLPERLGIDLTPERKEGESMEDYRKRRKEASEFKKWIKSDFGIRRVWNSSVDGTYRKIM